MECDLDALFIILNTEGSRTVRGSRREKIVQIYFEGCQKMALRTMTIGKAAYRLSSYRTTN